MASSSVAVAYRPDQRDHGRLQWPVPPPPWQRELTRRRPPCLATLLYDPLSGYQPVRFGPLHGLALPDALQLHGFPRRPNFWVGSPEAPCQIAVFRRGGGLSAEYLLLTTDARCPEGRPNGVFVPYCYALVGLLESLLPAWDGARGESETGGTAR